MMKKASCLIAYTLLFVLFLFIVLRLLIADHYYKMGKIAMHEEDYEKALNLFEASCNLNSFVYEPYLKAGKIMNIKEDYKSALVKNLKAFKNAPNNQYIYNNLGISYRGVKKISDEQEPIVTQDYYVDVSGKSPRYYQSIAINRAIEAIAKGENRILLVMATGTGKTYTAFQIIWRLWKAGIKKRILFLADRNILVDQTRVNDFKPFGSAMTKIKNRKVDKSYEIYLALYQAVSGTEEIQNIYKAFSPDFFDLIIIDECHRGSAAEDSVWREILDYFKKIDSVDTEDVPPMYHVLYLVNIFREDEVLPSLPEKEVLKNAPKKERRFFRAPRLI